MEKTIQTVCQEKCHCQNNMIIISKISFSKKKENYINIYKFQNIHNKDVVNTSSAIINCAVRE